MNYIIISLPCLNTCIEKMKKIINIKEKKTKKKELSYIKPKQVLTTENFEEIGYKLGVSFPMI